MTQQSLENFAGKGDIAGNQHFLLFSQYLIPFQKQILYLELDIILSPKNVFKFREVKVLVICWRVLRKINGNVA